MPSDRVSAWAAVCLSVPENVRFNKLLPVTCADMISVGRVRCSIKQHCYGIWVACGNTLRSQRLNKDLIAKLKWGRLLLLSVGGLSAIFHLWFCNGVMEMETESGSWVGTCQRWHRYPGWYWWPADSLKITLLPLCQQQYSETSTGPWGEWCYPPQMLQRLQQLPVIH